MTDDKFISGLFIKEKNLRGKTGDYSVMNVGIKVDELIEQLNKIKKENGFANIIIKRRKSTSDSGLTHYAEIDTWEPKARTSESVRGTFQPEGNGYVAPTSQTQEIRIEDIPF
jgi:hypothetical protein